MKQTYAFIMAGTMMLMSGGLISCSGENTTGVEVEGEGAGIDSEIQDNAEYGEGSTSDYENLDGINDDPTMDTEVGMDTARTTTPTVDNGF